ncbi:MAG TPA: hypothetical protein VGO16_04240 [Pseudonocardiaceae bacterium]|jgi:hypothetical protein|nr:hypothetical protein [Pseudonocardiaceae bacterium]
MLASWPVAGEGNVLLQHFGPDTVCQTHAPSRQRLDAVAVLAERESQLSARQRLALVDAAASWLSKLNGEINWRMRCWARHAWTRSPPSKSIWR